MAKGHDLVGHLFDWEIERDGNDYRVVVVEPAFLEPETHAAIFQSAITALISPELFPISGIRRNEPEFERFDLLVFPECFLPAADLISSLQGLVGLERLGCVQVGLRPDLGAGHLFSTHALVELVEGLKSIPAVERSDIEKFEGWLLRQSFKSRFNIACFFTIDHLGLIRVCLHPKMLRSHFEANPRREADMTQADVLTLVNLLPRDPGHLSITVQPLICSDVLQIDTDHPGHRPLSAINDAAGAFPARTPDYVDVVAVATATPQTVNVAPGGTKTRSWHHLFQRSFIDAAGNSSFQRHAHAAFVLSNFWSLGARGDATAAPGGLSGVFLPVKPGSKDPIDPVQISAFGGDPTPEWTLPGTPLDAKRRNRAFLAHLDPNMGPRPLTRMQGFTINRLPRHASPWASTIGLRDFTTHTMDTTTGAQPTQFVEESKDNAQ